MMNEKRTHKRVSPEQSILIKEDDGTLINYYTLGNISNGGMYLLKKISTKAGLRSDFTILTPELKDVKIKGTVVGTRFENGIYGTAIVFEDLDDKILGFVGSF
jgi:hypothetical protein